MICSRIQQGENCAIVTDAGMPAISDPGEDLVRLCHELGIQVVSVPGPTAFATALAVSGMETGRFTFEGFLSVSKKSRFEHLEEIKDEKRTIIFYEAPHKLRATLDDLREAFGEGRRIALSRELTKLHEETLRMTLEEAAAYFAETAPRGEFVLIVEGAPEMPEVDNDAQMEAALQMVQERIRKGETLKDAVKAVSAEQGVKKNALYQRAIDTE